MKKSKKRTTDDYVKSAKILAKFAPSLAKYKRRKKLSAQEKAAITRKENLLRFASELVPVTKKQARLLKNELFAPGIRAIQLRNTGGKAKIKIIKKDLMITVNGRTWIYWRLDKFDTESIEYAGTVAFTQIRQAFPLEKVAELADRAFSSLKTKEVYLWSKQGRVGEGFKDIESFMEWVGESYGGYNNPSAWVNGIAIRL
jgi:hypothetical protein